MLELIQKFCQPLALGTFILAVATIIIANSGRYKQKEEKSKFFLDECKGIFNRVVDLLSDGSNEQCKWHSAYFLLKDCHELMKKITLKAHKISLSANYKVFCMNMSELIRKITDPRFFLGVLNYKDYTLKEEAKKLHSFQEVVPGKFTIRDYRISPGRLSFILRFIDLDRGNVYKNNQVKPDFDINKVINNSIDESPFDYNEIDYFRYKGFFVTCEYLENDLD
jgi:hypothetical protein